MLARRQALLLAWWMGACTAAAPPQPADPTPRVSAIPEGFFALTAELTVTDVDDALPFYQRGLGARVMQRQAAPDGRTAHAHMKIGDSIVAVDRGPQTPAALGGSPVALIVRHADAQEAFTRAVEAGASPTGRPGELLDPAGHRWAIAGAVEDDAMNHSVTLAVWVPDAAEAVEFYKSALGASVARRAEGTAEHWDVAIGDSRMRVTEERADLGTSSAATLGGSPVTIQHYVVDADAVYQRAIQAGAESIAVPQDAVWGDRYGAVRDPSGLPWGIATRIEELTADQIEARRRASKAEKR